MSRAKQPDLLDWNPPQPVTAFPPTAVQAASHAGRLARAIGVALRDSGLSRDGVGARMSEYLGVQVSKAMLDAYASQGREDHVISTTRFAALLHATGDRRLLELLAEPHGWTVIERRYLPLIDLAVVRDRVDRLQREADGLRRAARSGGLL